MSPYFEKEKLDPHLTAIADPSGVRCFLVEGSERALLIDTCSGVGNLAEYVATLTDKPLTVWVTHGHVDHVGGAGWFDTVHLNAADTAAAQDGMALAHRREYVRTAMDGELPPDDAFCPVETRSFAPLDDGDTLDLGGLHAQALAFPGHTQGSMAVLLPELETALLGDACNTRVYLFGPWASTVADYRASADHFRHTYAHLYRQALVSHGPSPYVDPAILNNCVILCEQILAGMDDREPGTKIGVPVYFAKRERRPGLRADGGFGNILYGRDKI